MHLFVVYYDSRLAIIYAIGLSISITFFLYSLSLHLRNRLDAVVYTVNILCMYGMDEFDEGSFIPLISACAQRMGLMKECYSAQVDRRTNVL